MAQKTQRRSSITILPVAEGGGKKIKSVQITTTMFCLPSLAEKSRIAYGKYRARKALDFGAEARDLRLAEEGRDGVKAFTPEPVY